MAGKLDLVDGFPEGLIGKNAGSLFYQILHWIASFAVVNKRFSYRNQEIQVIADPFHDDPRPDIIESSIGLVEAHQRKIHQGTDFSLETHVHAAHREILMASNNLVDGRQLDSRSPAEALDGIEIRHAFPKAHVEHDILQRAEVFVGQSTSSMARYAFCPTRGFFKRLDVILNERNARYGQTVVVQCEDVFGSHVVGQPEAE